MEIPIGTIGERRCTNPERVYSIATRAMFEEFWNNRLEIRVEDSVLVDTFGL